MGFEIAEQFDWKLPDCIIYPTGGGTGIVGMWKAFDELEKIGWISGPKPQLVSVQSATCAPIYEAIRNGRDEVLPFANAHTIASGLRVPNPFASQEILRAIRESKGNVVTVEDSEMIEAVRMFAKDGIFACPEGAATLAAVRHLIDNNFIDKSERIVLYNTGSALKYLDVLRQEILPKPAPS